MTFILDASAAMSWCFEDESDEWSDAILDRLQQGSGIVPDIWSLEITNVLIQCERKRRLTEAQSAAFFQNLRSLPILVLPISQEEMFSHLAHLARREGLSSYDAAYLYLSLREGQPLATRDKALRLAAQKLGATLI